jgi:hypothetical protein
VHKERRSEDDEEMTLPEDHTLNQKNQKNQKKSTKKNQKIRYRLQRKCLMPSNENLQIALSIG